MIVTIHQPEHLPWLGFFDKLISADVFVCLDTVQFRKNYFQNRNRILTASGPIWLTVPVKTKGHLESTLADTEIANDGRWARKYWKTVSQNYGRHPFFQSHAGRFMDIFQRDWTRLVDLNLALIEVFWETFGIERQVLLASSLGVGGKSSQLLLDICRRTSATTYLSGPAGQDYLDESLFAAAGIEVRYHEFTHPTYPQVGADEFVSNLSALDLVMNLGPEGLAVLPSAVAGERA